MKAQDHARAVLLRITLLCISPRKRIEDVEVVLLLADKPLFFERVPHVFGNGRNLRPGWRHHQDGSPGLESIHVGLSGGDVKLVTGKLSDRAYPFQLGERFHGALLRRQLDRAAIRSPRCS